MDLLKKLLLVQALFFLCSCAKTSYLVNQGLGQFSLQIHGVRNEKILSDPNVDLKTKERIELITKAKHHFYQFWQKPPKDIYSKTTILDQEEVTTLVIVSPHDKIEPQKECFWFMGCFPYLGFFKREAALKYAAQKNEQGFITVTRPVYAYSTLGYFSDRILSSFFVFSDEDLIDLIFHELYHTIFFIKNEVDLNENLANFFAREMTNDYLKLAEVDLKKRDNLRQQDRVLSQALVKLTAELNERYSKLHLPKREETDRVFEDFMQQRFSPEIKLICEQQKMEIERCFPLNRDWNNASLAAFLTYENRAQEIEELYQKFQLSLQDFQLYIEDKYTQYLKEKTKDSFENFLFATPL